MSTLSFSVTKRTTARVSTAKTKIISKFIGYKKDAARASYISPLNYY
jgi:hypothetical protein